jgi:hypothetical protein
MPREEELCLLYFDTWSEGGLKDLERRGHDRIEGWTGSKDDVGESVVMRQEGERYYVDRDSQHRGSNKTQTHHLASRGFNLSSHTSVRPKSAMA